MRQHFEQYLGWRPLSMHMLGTGDLHSECEYRFDDEQPRTALCGGAVS